MLEGFPLYFWEFLILNLPLYRLLMATPKRGLNTLNYPAGIGTTVATQPYMLLTSYESKNATQSVGHIGNKSNAASISSIALYIPPNALKTAYTADWQGLEGGALRAAAGGAISDFVTGKAGYGGNFLWESVKSAGVGMLAKAAKQIEKSTGFLSAAHGLAVNNHMALTYRGVTKFREHQFAFSFFPKNVGDSKIVRNIIKDFRDGMLPRMQGGGDMVMQKNNRLSAPFFNSPRHWTIEFHVPGMPAENEFLFKVGKSVITSMDVNHDPNSTVSLHKDGSPVQTVVSLTFQEIEIQINDHEGNTARQETIEASLNAQYERESRTVNPHER
jgi:hypothetical protein